MKGSAELENGRVEGAEADTSLGKERQHLAFFFFSVSLQEGRGRMHNSRSGLSIRQQIQLDPPQSSPSDENLMILLIHMRIY